jgi:hypothetical protein
VLPTIEIDWEAFWASDRGKALEEAFRYTTDSICSLTHTEAEMEYRLFIKEERAKIDDGFIC